MSYPRRHGTRRVPQWVPLPGQVVNSAGGHAWAVDVWTRLRRFLVLGSEGGSYYATESTLTRENARAVEIADCNDRITLEFDVDSEAGRANSLHKLDTLLAALRVFREGVVAEFEPYDQRERELAEQRD